MNDLISYLLGTATGLLWGFVSILAKIPASLHDYSTHHVLTLGDLVVKGVKILSGKT